jgi:threonine/homoserine/homoserine lactone efflux protein
MFDAGQLTLYIGAAALLVITPGPDLLYVLTMSIGRGTRAGVLSAAGVSMGVLIHTLAVTFGLAVLLQTSTIAYTLIKYLGGLYLIYLGVQTLRHPLDLSLNQAGALTACKREYFVRGMMSNVLNPKVALFFLTFLPQFVTAEGGSATMQMLALGIIYALLAISIKSSVAMMSGSVSGWLRNAPGKANKLRYGMAAIFILLGGRLLLPEG